MMRHDRDEVERLRAEIRDRESERADLRDRVQKAEAQVVRLALRGDEWRSDALEAQNEVARLRALAARVEALVVGSLPIGWNSEMGAVVFTDPRTARRVPLRDWLKGPS